MSFDTIPTKSFFEINISNFLSEINIALSSINFMDENELSSLTNNSYNDEKFHKINSNVYLVSCISSKCNSNLNDCESTTSFFISNIINVKVKQS